MLHVVRSLTATSSVDSRIGTEFMHVSRSVSRDLNECRLTTALSASFCDGSFRLASV